MSEPNETDQPAVLTERRDRILVITLNRPDAMNAINGDLSNGLWNLSLIHISEPTRQ